MPAESAVRAGACSSIVRKYSDHISLPIRMTPEATTEADAASGKRSIRPARSGRAPSQRLDDEQYREFYKHLSNDFRSATGLDP